VTTENEFIRTLAKRFPVRPPVEVGIGDDGAVLNDPRAPRTIIVTDMLLDGIHFDLNRTSPRLAGRKAVAVNLSDLAAMACRPTAAFVSIAVPKSLRTSAADFLAELYGGIEELTEQYEFTLAGGDTNSWDGRLAINVCLTGVPVGSHPVLRSGAQSGDVLFVTGALGGSLHQDRHLSFSPRLEIAEWLIRHVPVNASGWRKPAAAPPFSMKSGYRFMPTSRIRCRLTRDWMRRSVMEKTSSCCSASIGGRW